MKVNTVSSRQKIPQGKPNRPEGEILLLAGDIIPLAEIYRICYGTVDLMSRQMLIMDIRTQL